MAYRRDLNSGLIENRPTWSRMGKERRRAELLYTCEIHVNGRVVARTQGRRLPMSCPPHEGRLNRSSPYLLRGSGSNSAGPDRRVPVHKEESRFDSHSGVRLRSDDAQPAGCPQPCSFTGVFLSFTAHVAGEASDGHRGEQSVSATVLSSDR